MITSSQLLLGSLLLFIIYRTVVAYRSKTLSVGFTVTWLLFWSVGLILVIKQEWVISLANWIGIGRGVDLVIYLSIILLYYLIYTVLIRLQEIEENLTRIIRGLALKSPSRKVRRVDR